MKKMTKFAIITVVSIFMLLADISLLTLQFVPEANAIFGVRRRAARRGVIVGYTAGAAAASSAAASQATATSQQQAAQRSNSRRQHRRLLHRLQTQRNSCRLAP